MENRLVTSQQLTEFDSPLPDNVHLAAFKLVAFGPKTLEETGRIGQKICEIAEKQSTFFIISETPEALRQSMHDLVDRFCNIVEGNKT